MGIDYFSKIKKKMQSSSTDSRKLFPFVSDVSYHI